MKNQDIMLFDVAKENTYIATYRPEFTHENRTIKFELRPKKKKHIGLSNVFFMVINLKRPVTFTEDRLMSAISSNTVNIKLS